MTAKEYLRQIRKVSDIIRMKGESLKELESAVEYAAPVMSDMPRSGSDPAKKRTDALVRLMDAKDELARMIARDVEIRRKAIGMIESVQDCTTRWIMYSRYLDGCSWKDIISKSGYSERTVYEMHGRGLQDIDRRYRSELSAM